MPFADYQRHLANNRAYAQTAEGKEARLRANRTYRRRKADRVRAHNAISKAVLRGKLLPWPACAVPECECTKVEAHHPDYSRPLDVVWLCDKHHKEVHAMARNAAVPPTPRPDKSGLFIGA